MLKQPTRWIPLLLFLFSLFVRLITIRLFQFDGLYGQDSFAYYEYALALRQALLAGQLPPAFFWPIGYPALIVMTTAVFGITPAAGQLVSVVAGAAIAPLVYLIVRDYAPKAIAGGVIAGLLAALASQLLLSSISIMSDTASLFWATCSAWAMIHYLKKLQWRYLAIATITFAFAILTRWVYGLLVIPWGISALLAWRTANLSWRQMAKTAVFAILLGGAILTLHFVPDIARGNLSYAGDLEVYSWHPANAFTRELHNTDGDFVYEYPTGWFYARPSFHPAYIFPFFALFWLLGIWAIRRQPPALIVLLVGWPLTIYLFLAGVPWQNWRFPLSFFPPLLVLVGLGIHWAQQRLQERWRTALFAACAIALLGSAAWSVRDINDFTTRFNDQKAITAVIANQLPPDATLIAFGLTATLQQYTEIETLELFHLDQADLREIVEGKTAVYLLIDPENVSSQWADMDVGRNMRWLQATYHVTEIAPLDPFVLYQVAP